jgi:hypothetical protein
MESSARAVKSTEAWNETRSFTGAKFIRLIEIPLRIVENSSHV